METEQWSEEFFLIAHNEFTGRPHINRDLLGCGLVAAQFAQLVASRRLSVVDGRVAAPPETDSAAGGARALDTEAQDIDAYVIESVQRQPSGHTVRTWTTSLADVLHELLGRRLVEAGVVRREQGGGLLRRRPDRFPSVDLLRAARPRLRLENMLRRPRELDLQNGFTAALVWALGVDGVLDPELDRAEARELVDEIGERLPADLQELLAGTRAAVAAVSLTVRR